MENLMLPQYRFTDITVFMNTNNKGEYLNITDYSFVEEENERLYFESDSPFIIMFCSFCYPSCRNKGETVYICDITLEELTSMAGVRDKAFLKRFSSSEGESHNELLAILCARRILDYRYGKVIKGEDNTYSFYRQASYKVDGKVRKKKSLICEKHFYQA